MVKEVDKMRDRLIALNRPVLSLGDMHPAKRFLIAFGECLDDCGGCELGLYETPIDQEWLSRCDGKVWTFSAFVYKHLAFDVLLDGFLTNAPHWTDSEKSALEMLPHYRALMDECALAARQCHNTDCLELVEIVVNMLTQWEAYLDFRKEMIASSQHGNAR